MRAQQTRGVSNGDADVGDVFSSPSYQRQLCAAFPFLRWQSICLTRDVIGGRRIKTTLGGSANDAAWRAACAA